jgi:hypothetical protein
MYSIKSASIKYGKCRGPSKIVACIVLMGNAQPFEPHLVADLHLSGNLPLMVHVRRSRISVESASDDFNSATNELGQSWTEQIVA